MLLLAIGGGLGLSCAAKGQSPWSGCHGEEMKGGESWTLGFPFHLIAHPAAQHTAAQQEVAVRKGCTNSTPCVARRAIVG